MFEKDHALTRRFQKIDVVEPSVEETIEILKGLKSRFEAHHSIKYTVNALTTAAELSAKYINDRHLPDKAIDVIDEAGAAQRIAPKAKQKKVIGKTEIEDIIAKIARIPPRSVSTDDRSALANLDRDLRAVVFGQDKAIEALASAIKMARSGLGNPQKPIGNFLFSGPTGVGKTELARQLAYCMGIELIRFDMSEYMERHAVSRLIGAPPGYVGFEQGGLLTEAISKKPYCVLLLDEIEKAHPDIFNILLQVMDHGTLTDNNGRKADFRNVVIVMTTNAGAESLAKNSMGFTHSVKAGDEMEAIKKTFTPEFRNRLDAVISFGALDHGIILRVVDKFLMQLEEQLAEKKVEAAFTPALKEHLAKKGFDPLMGARPMARLIQDTIRRALADELLFGKLVHGGQGDHRRGCGRQGRAALRGTGAGGPAGRRSAGGLSSPQKARDCPHVSRAFCYVLMRAALLDRLRTRTRNWVFTAAGYRMRILLFATAVLLALPVAAQDLQGRNLAASCAICHGTEGRAVTKDMASLAGLPKDYLVQQLQDFKSGKRPANRDAPACEGLHRRADRSDGGLVRRAEALRERRWNAEISSSSRRRYPSPAAPERLQDARGGGRRGLRRRHGRQIPAPVGSGDRGGAGRARQPVHFLPAFQPGAGGLHENG